MSLILVLAACFELMSSYTVAGPEDLHHGAGVRIVPCDITMSDFLLHWPFDPFSIIACSNAFQYIDSVEGLIQRNLTFPTCLT